MGTWGSARPPLFSPALVLLSKATAAVLFVFPEEVGQVFSQDAPWDAVGEEGHTTSFNLVRLG